MSAEAMGYVYRHSPYTGATFQVHLAIADSVNDQFGHELWAAVATVATKARVTRPTASRAMAQIVEDGGLVVVEDHRSDRAGKPSRYRFQFPDWPVVYETRGGVSREHTPTAGGVSTAHTGVCREDTGGVSREHTNPREPKQEPKGAETSSATPPGQSDRGSTSSRKTTLPDRWTPTDQHRFLARSEGVDCEREAAKFRDHAIAKRATYVDWDAAFRTWLRKAGEWAGPRRDVSDDGFRAVWDA